jgi:hypothetical protein
VLRVSAACEAAGVPSSSLVCEGFLGQARAISLGLGLPKMPVAMVPGHPGTQSPEELRRNIIEFTIERIIESLTASHELEGLEEEPAAREIVFAGGFDAVQDYYCAREWSDGLPVTPPTRAKVEQFLRFTDREADEVLGVAAPDNRLASVWSIAVNGVMAGCRPEYMPILVAIVEALVDPVYGVEHSGNTTGAETQIILNGPLVKRLGFNYTQGVMRDGFRPNTSIGRFLRLYLRNVIGFLPHKTDKGTYGGTWRVVVPENEDALADIGWQPTSVDMGYAAGDDVVTIARYSGGDVIASVSGSTPETVVPILADGVARLMGWHLTFIIGAAYGMLRPLVFISPVIARMIAGAGWSKADVQRCLFEQARIPAWRFERALRDWMGVAVWNLAEEVQAGRAPRVFHESDDPERLVPVVFRPEDFMVVVTGDPLRTNAYVFAHNGLRGYPVAKRIALPREWDALMAELGR